MAFNDFLREKYVPNISYASAFLALLIILFMIGMSIYDRKLVDRVSLRLQTALAVYDLWLHSGPLWRTSLTKSAGPVCTFLAWSFLAFRLFYLFINVSIGINLQLVFIHNMVVTKKIEAAYWIVPIFVIIVITIPPLALGILGWSKYNGCYISEAYIDNFQGIIFDILANQMWRVFTLIYLIVTIVIVFIKLNRKAVLVGSQKLKSSSESTLKTIKTIKILGYRMYFYIYYISNHQSFRLLYPIAMLITNFAGIVSQFYYDFSSEPSVFLDNWTSITYPLMGALNFIAFCCDPTVHDAIKVVLYKIKVKKNCKKKDNDNQPGMELDAINSALEESVNARNPNDGNVDDETFNNPMESL